MQLWWISFPPATSRGSQLEKINSENRSYESPWRLSARVCDNSTVRYKVPAAYWRSLSIVQNQAWYHARAKAGIHRKVLSSPKEHSRYWKNLSWFFSSWWLSISIGLISLEIGPSLDDSRAHGYDMGITLVLESRAHVKQFAEHPLHLKWALFSVSRLILDWI